MDIVSHGLWGGVAVGRRTRKTFWLAVFFGMLPDLLSFGVFTVASVLGLSRRPDWSAGPPPMDLIPQYVHVLYNISHSLVIFAVVFVVVRLFARSYATPFLAYGLAVLVDIPTHSTDFFATPFLWPISTYQFNGVSWGHPGIFFTNLALLAGAYALWYGRTRKRTIEQRERMSA